MCSSTVSAASAESLLATSDRSSKILRRTLGFEVSVNVLRGMECPHEKQLEIRQVLPAVERRQGLLRVCVQHWEVELVKMDVNDVEGFGHSALCPI
jgi:hypothetical protein